MKTAHIVWAIVAIAVLALVAVFVPIEQTLIDITQWMQANPGLALQSYALVLMSAIVLMMPTFILLLAAGYLFGLTEAMLVAWLAYLLGSMLAFMLGRTVARNWVEQKTHTMPRFQALDRAVGRSGFQIVLLTRLAMVIPYNLLNYAYGLTGVTLRDYGLGTALGSLPFIGIYVYLGTTATNLSSLRDTGDLDWRILVLELAFLIAAVVLVTRVAARALRKELADEGP